MRAPAWSTLLRRADSAVDASLRDLPPELQEVARQVPVTYEPMPSREMVDDGVDPDTLGLFLGYAHQQVPDGAPSPVQIILFLENLYYFSAEEGEEYETEVARTYLHELGHYLGLDEDGLALRGLD